jgi:hypothetical protein
MLSNRDHNDDSRFMALGALPAVSVFWLLLALLWAVIR